MRIETTVKNMDIKSDNKLIQVIYYTGIGSCGNKLYLPEKFINLMNEHVNQFNIRPDDPPMPVLDSTNYTQEELTALIEWNGAIQYWINS